MNILIENSNSLKNLYSKIIKDQNKYSDLFKEEESNLKKKLSEINDLKMILNTDELDKEILDYNKILNNFNSKVENFNSYYDKQINKQKNILINKIIEILKDYSLQNKIDLILDENNYILSSNLINITDLILVKLNNVNTEINFKEYE